MNLIEPGLFLGDWQDGVEASNFAMSTLCVIEICPQYRYQGMAHYIPILEHDEDTYLADIPPKAFLHKLDEACEIIDDHLLNHEPLLVHCWAGVERSPLTLAYWLVRSKRQSTLDSAYALLKSKRPIVEDRRTWLPLSLAASL